MRRHGMLQRFRSGSRLLAALALFGGGCADMQDTEAARLIPAAGNPQKTGQIPVLNVKLVRTYPHDPHAFTQGLEYYGGEPHQNKTSARQADFPPLGPGDRERLPKNNPSSPYLPAGATKF